MILIENFEQVTAQIESERGITKETLVTAIEQALVSACRKKFPEEADLIAKINKMSGEAYIYQRKQVVEKVQNDLLEITEKDAKQFDPDVKVGGAIFINVTPSDFGRIAAQTAKQVIIQRIREAEKNVIYNEFKHKVDHVITGTVQRIENKNYLINLGRAEAILSAKEQIPGERFEAKEKIRLYVVDVQQNPRGTFIHVSRTHPGFLRCLFEQEIPEIQDGIIEVMSVAREPGKRSKVAVKSNNPSIGAVGTCVGHMGGRIQSIIKELGQEKIDVLEWHDDPKYFIANALKPAKISNVIIRDEAEKSAIVVVPNDQLSLAIGKNGINVRLSVKLTGWKLDIYSEDEYEKKSGELVGKPKSIVEKIRLEKEKLKNEETNVTALSSAFAAMVAEQQEEANSIKVTDLAKELNLSAKELIEASASLGIEIKSTRSKVSSADAETLRHELNKEG